MLIIVEFEGGFLDGKVARSDQEDPSLPWQASFVYYATKAKLGRRIRSITVAGLPAKSSEEYSGQAHAELGIEMDHYYEVVDRIEGEGQLTIRMKSVTPLPAD